MDVPFGNTERLDYSLGGIQVLTKSQIPFPATCHRQVFLHHLLELQALTSLIITSVSNPVERLETPHMLLT